MKTLAKIVALAFLAIVAPRQSSADVIYTIGATPMTAHIGLAPYDSVVSAGFFSGSITYTDDLQSVVRAYFVTSFTILDTGRYGAQAWTGGMYYYGDPAQSPFGSPGAGTPLHVATSGQSTTLTAPGLTATFSLNPQGDGTLALSEISGYTRSGSKTINGPLSTPEPTSIVTAAIGLGAVLGSVRRRQRAA